MRILLMKDIMRLFRVSRPTVYNWLAASRKGAGFFPLPISQAGCVHRWNADDIEAFMQPKSVPQPANIASPVKRKQKNKTLQQRQVALQQGMQRHGITNHFNQ